MIIQTTLSPHCSQKIFQNILFQMTGSYVLEFTLFPKLMSHSKSLVGLLVYTFDGLVLLQWQKYSGCISAFHTCSFYSKMFFCHLVEYEHIALFGVLQQIDIHPQVNTESKYCKAVFLHNANLVLFHNLQYDGPMSHTTTSTLLVFNILEAILQS